MHAKATIEATSNRRIHWILVLALATLALAAIGSQPAAAAPDVSKSDVLFICEASGGVYWESGGVYGCQMPGGLTIECDASGCLSWCYEPRGCRCDLHDDDVICIHGFTPNESDTPWDDTVHLDPYQEAKLPDEPASEPSSPDPAIELDEAIVNGGQVVKGAD